MSTSLANGAAGLAISGYILAVVFNKRGAELLAELKQDGGFVKWIGAVLIITALWTKMGKAAAPLMTLLILGIALEAEKTGALSKAMDDINAFFRG